MSNRDTRFEDPAQTEFALRQRGWMRIVEFDDEDVDSEYYFRVIEEDGHKLDVLLRLTPAGRQEFYVDDPPAVFREAAHDGRCLMSYDTPDHDEVYRLHFNREPDSVVDGVRLIRQLLRGGA